MHDIKQQLNEGSVKIQKFMEVKKKQAKDDDTVQKQKQREEIEDFEREAEELERVEMELLHRLQETQKQERDAYGKLENAMIDTSIPKKQRIYQNQSLGAVITQDGKVNKLEDLERVLQEKEQPKKKVKSRSKVDKQSFRAQYAPVGVHGYKN